MTDLDATSLGDLAPLEKQYQSQLEQDTSALSQLGTQEAQGRTPAPQVPQQPNFEAMKAAPFLIGLAAIGGHVSGIHARTMLGATNGMMQGLRQGSSQAYQESLQKYQQEYQQWLDKSNQERKLFDEMRQVFKGRIDADLRALQFARQAMGDQHRVTTDDLKNFFNSQGMSEKFQRLQETIRHDKDQEYLRQEEIDRQKQADQNRATAAASKQGSLGQRAQVQNQRVIRAGNEVTAAVSNIMELPITTSSGWFGSAKPGGSLLDSAKSVLANKMTSQDAQTYKKMMLGIARGLAMIENSGLAPSGSLTESMAGVELREGDTYMSKLRSMAEIRQVVEKGLEPILVDPQVSDQQKQFIKGVIDQVKHAVPFTHHEMTMLEQSTNPRVTIKDIATGKELIKQPSMETKDDSGWSIKRVD
jgi:hypothetical protein